MSGLLNDPYTMLTLAVIGFLWLAISIITAAACVSGSVLRRRRGRDMEALIEATWEPPEHVPDTWVKEFER